MRKATTTSVDRTRTLEELEDARWGEPEYDSYVVRTCHALRRKPLGTLTDEELRVGVGQRVGLGYLVPIAVERLRPNPLTAADHYEGDLLRSVLDVPSPFWAEHPDVREELTSIVREALTLVAGSGDEAWIRRWQIG